jgi:uncharacterized protein (UPF0332 family)
MKKQDFLSKLKIEGKLELVPPSDDIKESYLEKSANSLKASRLLLKSNLLEEATSMAYYAMYHALLALMFKCGIKCENHTGNILLPKSFFGEVALYEVISYAKKERVDKQYYTDFEVVIDDVEKLIVKSQDFATNVKVIIESLTSERIGTVRTKYESL